MRCRLFEQVSMHACTPRYQAWSIKPQVSSMVLTLIITYRRSCTSKTRMVIYDTAHTSQSLSVQQRPHEFANHIRILRPKVNNHE
jgi:hypothetical protein